MAKMTELVHGKLSAKLGPDTQHLMLRVGIHSGPVTAGVLRGDKGRFPKFPIVFERRIQGITVFRLSEPFMQDLTLVS